jgi:toxin ParE1/3/4
MTYTVEFTPEAEEQLAALFRYIAREADPAIAQRYASGIITYCEGLATFPRRGVRRDDIRPGLRVTNYKKRTVIAFMVEAGRVSIIGVFYGGQDYEESLEGEQ